MSGDGKKPEDILHRAYVCVVPRACGARARAARGA